MEGRKHEIRQGETARGDAVLKEAVANAVESSEAGMTIQSYSKLEITGLGTFQT